MEKKSRKVLVLLLIIVILGLGYFAFSRYLVSKLDGAGVLLFERDNETEVKRDTINLLFVGDIMLDRTVRTKIERYGADYIFEDIKKIFENVDIAIGNLEGAITQNESLSQHDHTILRFTFATSTASYLRSLGFTHLGLANNHSLDFGEFGFDDTRYYLAQAGLGAFGSPHNDRNISTITSSKDEEVCLVGYHALYYSDTTSVLREVESNKESCSYTVVFAHWGEEYVAEESGSQRESARSFIDAGADLVIGAHPHVIQPVEIYKGRAIFYSLGNFVFDQDFSLATRQGLALRLELDEDSQKFYLIRVGVESGKLYFPDEIAYKPSMDVLISKLSSEMRALAGGEGVIILER